MKDSVYEEQLFGKADTYRQVQQYLQLYRVS